MKRILFIILAVVAINAKGAEQVQEPSVAFVNAPMEIFPSLETSTRMDMIDYYDCGYNRPSIDLFEDSAIIVRKDSLCVEVKIGEKQLHQLSMPNDNLVVLISTLPIPMLDSEIRFFDYNWEQLPSTKYITLPTLADWLTDEGKKNRIEVENMFPFIAAKYDFDVYKGGLTITNSMQEYFDKDTWQRVSKWVKPSIQYKWTGRKFKKQ